jgi:hypothetical protein
MPKSITATEHQIQGAIIDLIRARGGVVTRVNSGAAIFKRGNEIQVIRGAEKGTSDLIFCYKGIYCACEVKRPGAKPAREDQIAFLESVAEAGGVGLVAYDSMIVESVMDGIDKHAKGDDWYDYFTGNMKNKFFVP